MYALSSHTTTPGTVVYDSGKVYLSNNKVLENIVYFPLRIDFVILDKNLVRNEKVNNQIL